jgi:hypothetical protein
MKRIKHRDLLPYFIDDERSLAKRRAYVASCRKFFKELSNKQQATSDKLQASSLKQQAASLTSKVQ